MPRSLTTTIAVLLAVSGSALLLGCPTSVQPQSTSGALVPGPGERIIRGRVTGEGIEASAGVISAGSGNVISAGALNNRVLQAPTGSGKGTVKCSSPIDTREVDIKDDGSFEVPVKAGAQYDLEASVPDGKGGVFKAAGKVDVPLAQDPQVADIVSLVTRRTGSISGLIALAGGQSPEGADVFLSGGTSVVGKVAESGRFALTNVAEGTWNVVIMKPGFKRHVIPGVQVRAGRATSVPSRIVLEAESGNQAGVRGRVMDANGNAIVGASVSAYPVDRSAIANLEGGLTNFTAITNDQGEFEMLDLPATAYQVQVYRPFYQLPPRREVTVQAGQTADLGTVQLTSTVAYFGRISGRVVDLAGKPIDGAVVQTEPQVTDQQFTDADGNFTLDRVMPGEYNLSISAGGHATVVRPIRVENRPDFTVRLDQPLTLQPGEGFDLDLGRGQAPFPDEPASTAAGPGCADGTQVELAWIGLAGDHVGVRYVANPFAPDGRPDGHFRLTIIPKPGVSSIDLHGMYLRSSDAQGGPLGGSGYETYSANNWPIGVYVDGRPLNTAYRGQFGPVAVKDGKVVLDLYCQASDLSWSSSRVIFFDYQHYTMHLRLTESCEIKATTAITR